VAGVYMFVPRSQQNLVSTIAFNRWRRIHATWQVFNWGQNVDRVRRCGTSRVAYLASLGRCDPIADEFIWCLSLTRVLKSFNLLPHYAKWVLVKLSGCTACSIVDVYLSGPLQVTSSKLLTYCALRLTQPPILSETINE